MIKLRYDPYQIFRSSKTPPGLYARQKWLGETGTPRWESDFRETVAALMADQLPDGSWQHATVTTIKRLFGLHLTVRSSNERIDTALNWLLKKIDLQTSEILVSAGDVPADANLTGLPFMPSKPKMFLVGATLFLATIFGREKDRVIIDIYKWLSAHGINKRGRWLDKASTHNIFRSMVVHPLFAKDKATALAAEYFAENQTENGDWGEDLPYYQTLNAVAHLDLQTTDKQLEKAFRRLSETQNEDGSWSRSEPEWNSFLAVHALKNKGYL